MKSKRLFISYSHANRGHPILRRLLNDLGGHEDLKVWFDEDQIGFGDSVIDAISKGIHGADFVLHVVSDATRRTGWAQHEFFIAYADQVQRQRPKLLIVVIDPGPLPSYLRQIPFIDLTNDYSAGFKNLLSFVTEPPGRILATFDTDASIHNRTVISVAASVSQALIDHFLRHPGELKKVDRRKFEELVAELFDGFGYNVELTKRTRDGGRDVIAIREREVSVKYLIECKRPEPDGIVGIRPVRELLGVKSDERATKAILATTVGFSREALLFFERNRWELEPRDYEGVIKWLKEYRTLKVRP